MNKLQGLLDEKRRQEKADVDETPRKIIPTEIKPAMPMTPISPISFKLERKRGGEFGEEPKQMSRVRHTKHPRRNHYSDKALLAIHTVVAHYHTKERALAPAM